MKKLLVLMLVGVMLLMGCGGAEEPAPAPAAPLVDRIAAIEGELVRLASKVASAPDVSAIQGELSALRDEISTLRDEVSAPNDRLTEQLGDLEERIESLEEEKQEEEEGDIDPEDAIEIGEQYAKTLKPPYDSGVLAPEATYRLSTRVKITLENQLSVDLEDIELSAEVDVESETSGIKVVNIELVGADFDWDSYGGDYFISWGSIKIGANSSDRYLSTLYITVKNTSLVPMTTYEVSIERLRVECEDYEVKS